MAVGPTVTGFFDQAKHLFSGRRPTTQDADLASPTLPQPGEDDERLVRLVNGLWEQAKSAKRTKYHPKWLKNHELFRNKHWPELRAKGQSKATINLIFSAVNRSENVLTDNSPTFDIYPGEVSDKATAKSLAKVQPVWWQQHHGQLTMRRGVHAMELYGTGVWKLGWDPEAEHGIGDIFMTELDPFAVFPDPTTQHFMPFDGRYVFHAYPIDPAEAVRQYGLDPKEIPLGVDEDLLGASRYWVQGGTSASGVIGSMLPSGYGTPSGAGPGHSPWAQQAFARELWIYDYTMVPDVILQPIVDPTTRQVVGVQQVPIERPKYPGNIRCITLIGNHIVSDRPNPNIMTDAEGRWSEQASWRYLFDHFPFAFALSYEDGPGWGFGISEQIEDLVKELDKTVARLSDYTNLLLEPPLILPLDCGIDEKTVSTNKPRMILKPINGMVSQYIRFVQVPSLPNDFEVKLSLLMRVVDIITGIHDVMEGRKPSGIQAASAIIALQEKGAVIFRNKIASLDAALDAIGNMWVSLAQEFYTEERQFMVVGQTPEDLQPVMVGPQIAAGKYDVKVRPGSTLPMNKFTQQQQAIQLHQAGAIDQRALLDVLDWPDREEVLARTDQIKQLTSIIEQWKPIIDRLQKQQVTEMTRPPKESNAAA